MLLLLVTEGIPKVWWYGVFESKYQAMVIDKYDTTLRDILVGANASLPVPIIVDAAIKLLPILERIHNRSIVHSDIKPRNIGVMYGNDEKNMLENEYYFFDFGLSRKYIKSSQHINFREKHGELFCNNSAIDSSLLPLCFQA